MSDDELESLLRQLPQRTPRPKLRAEVLNAVRSALTPAKDAVPLLDRWLARPMAWVAPAVLLVGLLVGQWVLERSLERRTASHAEAARREPDETNREACGGVPCFQRNRALVLSLVSGEANGV